MALERTPVKPVKKQSLKEKWRLSASIFNGLRPKETGSLRIKDFDYPFYRIYTGKDGKQFAVFNVVKDADTPTNQPELFPIKAIIAAAKAKTELQDATLLIPMQQCRGFGKAPTFFTFLKRAHIVLVEADLQSKQIKIHDSKKEKKFTYANKLKDKDIATQLGLRYNPDENYLDYGTQQGEIECGYYVDQYIRALIDGTPCADIQFIVEKNGTLSLQRGKGEKVTYNTMEDYLNA